MRAREAYTTTEVGQYTGASASFVAREWEHTGERQETRAIAVLYSIKLLYGIGRSQMLLLSIS